MIVVGVKGDSGQSKTVYDDQLKIRTCQIRGKPTKSALVMIMQEDASNRQVKLEYDVL